MMYRPRRGRRGAGQRDRNEAARLPLEQQQLDRQQHRRATGAAKVADMPAAAPATSSVFRSAAVR